MLRKARKAVGPGLSGREDFTVLNSSSLIYFILLLLFKHIDGQTKDETLQDENEINKDKLQDVITRVDFQKIFIWSDSKSYSFKTSEFQQHVLNNTTQYKLFLFILNLYWAAFFLTAFKF